MSMTIAVLAVAFRVLTPTEASAMKIGTIEDPARAFASFAEGYDAVAAEPLPPHMARTGPRRAPERCGGRRLNSKMTR